MTAVRLFFRLTGWLLLFGAIFGAVAGVLEPIVLDWRVDGILTTAYFGVFYGAIAAGAVGIPTAIFITLLTLTPLRRFRTMPFIVVTIVLVPLYVFVFHGGPVGEESPYFGGDFANYVHWAIFTIITLALFTSVHQVFRVKAPQQTDNETVDPSMV